MEFKKENNSENEDILDGGLTEVTRKLDSGDESDTKNENDEKLIVKSMNTHMPKLSFD